MGETVDNKRIKIDPKDENWNQKLETFALTITKFYSQGNPKYAMHSILDPQDNDITRSLGLCHPLFIYDDNLCENNANDHLILPLFIKNPDVFDLNNKIWPIPPITIVEHNGIRILHPITRNDAHSYLIGHTKTKISKLFTDEVDILLVENPSDFANYDIQFLLKITPKTWSGLNKAIGKLELTDECYLENFNGREINKIRDRWNGSNNEAKANIGKRLLKYLGDESILIGWTEIKKKFYDIVIKSRMFNSVYMDLQSVMNDLSGIFNDDFIHFLRILAHNPQGSRLLQYLKTKKRYIKPNKYENGYCLLIGPPENYILGVENAIDRLIKNPREDLTKIANNMLNINYYDNIFKDVVNTLAPVTFPSTYKPYYMEILYWDQTSKTKYYTEIASNFSPTFDEILKYARNRIALSTTYPSVAMFASYIQTAICIINNEFYSAEWLTKCMQPVFTFTQTIGHNVTYMEGDYIKKLNNINSHLYDVRVFPNTMIIHNVSIVVAIIRHDLKNLNKEDLFTEIRRKADILTFRNMPQALFECCNYIKSASVTQYKHIKNTKKIYEMQKEFISYMQIIKSWLKDDSNTNVTVEKPTRDTDVLYRIIFCKNDLPSSPDNKCFVAIDLMKRTFHLYFNSAQYFNADKPKELSENRIHLAPVDEAKIKEIIDKSYSDIAGANLWETFVGRNFIAPYESHVNTVNKIQNLAQYNLAQNNLKFANRESFFVHGFKCYRHFDQDFIEGLKKYFQEAIEVVKTPDSICSSWCQLYGGRVFDFKKFTLYDATNKLYRCGTALIYVKESGETVFKTYHFANKDEKYKNKVLFNRKLHSTIGLANMENLITEPFSFNLQIMELQNKYNALIAGV